MVQESEELQVGERDGVALDNRPQFCAAPGATSTHSPLSRRWSVVTC